MNCDYICAIKAWLNGVLCVYYRLESSTNWTTVYNGSDTEWIISDDKLNYHEAYVFTAAAKNKIGWGPFSNDSLPFIYTPRECSQELLRDTVWFNGHFTDFLGFPVVLIMVSKNTLKIGGAEFFEDLIF